MTKDGVIGNKGALVSPMSEGRVLIRKGVTANRPVELLASSRVIHHTRSLTHDYIHYRNNLLYIDVTRTKSPTRYSINEPWV